MELEICFEALRALWNGIDSQAARAVKVVRDEEGSPRWLDEVRANWTLDSMMMRHAVRLAVVGAVDVALIRVVHVNHGFWLAMTSIIVLQPGGAGTVRKGMQRVVGTIAGGVIAAGLAVALPEQTGIIAAITLCATLTLATFAVDYGWYCFFLTPTFVLMSLPHPRDWTYALVRMGTTVIGACVALAAMLFLLREHAAPELGRLLARGAAADGAHLRAVLRFWAVPTNARRQGQQSILAPARRRCGLASNEAEEALDRLLLEPGGWRDWHTRAGGGEQQAREQALRFVTYRRRLMQSTTTLAMLGRPSRSAVRRLEALATRLERLSEGLAAGHAAGHAEANSEEREITGPMVVDVMEDQMQRIARQITVLEEAAAALAIERAARTQDVEVTMAAG